MDLESKSIWQIAIGILGGLLGAGILLLVNAGPRGEPVTLIPPPTPGQIAVHVSGAVANPDVYTLPPSSRVEDAVEAAGGLADDAYTTSLNLALPLNDGDKVLVPTIPTPGPTPAPGKEQPVVIFPININTATQTELEQLPGIGPSLAQEIIAYREKNGPFTSIKQIKNVSGIGPSTYGKFEDLITIGE